MDRDAIFADITEQGYETVGVQCPDGMKDTAMDVAQHLREMGKTPLVVSASAFGACDLADETVMKMGAECLIHIGHSKFYVGGKPIEGNIPVYYMVEGLDWNIISVLENNLDAIPETTLGLVTVGQHMHMIDDIKAYLERQGKTVVLGGEGTRSQRNVQLLGCDSSAAQAIADQVDAMLYIGSGYFHPVKVVDADVKLYKVDPLEQTVEVVDPELRHKELRQELAKVMNHADEEKWGIIVSTKPGQFFPQMAQMVAKKLESFGKEPYFFLGDRIFEFDLVGFDVHIFVNTACPRLPPDFEQFSVVNPWALKALDEYYNGTATAAEDVIRNQDN